MSLFSLLCDISCAGDMVAIYKEGGPGHKKFDAVVTCFFIDTGDDLVDYFTTLDQVGSG